MATDIIVHPDPKRDAKAAELAEHVGSWPRIVLKQDHGAIPAGTVVRRAPSSTGNGTTYKVCALACTCPDYADWGNVCKHVRAYRLFESRQEAATTAAPAPRPTYDELYPACAGGCGDVVEKRGRRCYACESAAVTRETVAFKTACVAASR